MAKVKSSLATHRARMERRGFVRVEVNVRKDDAGLVRRDRSPKPALHAVSAAFAEIPFPADRLWPRISVVVCSYNGARTISSN